MVSYAAQQYQSLLNLLRVISLRIPLVKDNIVGHCHITSHRKIPKIDLVLILIGNT